MTQIPVLPTGFFPLLLQLACLYNPGPLAHRKYWPLPFHTSHQLRKCPTDSPTDLADGANFSVEVPSSPVTLVCVKLTTASPHMVL